MSTLLSDLDSAPGSSDGDLVQRIFSEMNGGNGGAGAPPPPQPSSMPPPAPMMNAPNPNSTAHMTMDTGPATAHVIGGSHPTPADFAAAMHSMQGSSYTVAAPPPMAAPKPYSGERRQAPPFRNRIVEEVRLPLLVTILVFVFSLPVIHVVFAHYLPSMVRSTGDLTTVGLLIKSLIAGGLFWFLQRVIVPLLSL